MTFTLLEVERAHLMGHAVLPLLCMCEESDPYFITNYTNYWEKTRRLYPDKLIAADQRRAVHRDQSTQNTVRTPPASRTKGGSRGQKGGGRRQTAGANVTWDGDPDAWGDEQ